MAFCFGFSHFADIVIDSDPDVIAVQEVRLDSSFYSVEKKIPYWKELNGSVHTKSDAGSQVEHLLSHFHAAAQRKGKVIDFTKYYFVYQPAMSMWEK